MNNIHVVNMLQSEHDLLEDFQIIVQIDNAIWLLDPLKLTLVMLI
jgi:hypothetical protein